MKKILIALAMSAAAMTAAHADGQPNGFRSFTKYALACESEGTDREHVRLEVVPEYNYVILGSRQGQFKFKIDFALPSVRTVYNDLGHEVFVPYIQMIKFRDFGGKTRILNWRAPWTTYTGDGFAYLCVPTTPDVP
jgi:hypothetical protein